MKIEIEVTEDEFNIWRKYLDINEYVSSRDSDVSAITAALEYAGLIINSAIVEREGV